MEAFAKKLVDSDGIIRTKAFIALGNWITERAENEDKKDLDVPFMQLKDSLRLWKALFYSMWMADKPMHQRSLAQRIGDLSLVISSSSKSFQTLNLFFRGFWETMCREWPNLDHHRLDKYYNLVRRMISASLECCILRSWNPTFVLAYNSVLRDTVLSPVRADVPDGLKMYLLEETCSVYEATLSSKNISKENIPQDLFLSLLDPLLNLIALNTKTSVGQCAHSRFQNSLTHLESYVSMESLGQHVIARGESHDVILAGNRKILSDAGLLIKGFSAEHAESVDVCLP